jgi:hypothetical protein
MKLFRLSQTETIPIIVLGLGLGIYEDAVAGIVFVAIFLTVLSITTLKK